MFWGRVCTSATSAFFGVLLHYMMLDQSVVSCGPSLIMSFMNDLTEIILMT